MRSEFELLIKQGGVGVIYAEYDIFTIVGNFDMYRGSYWDFKIIIGGRLLHVLKDP